MKSLHLDWDDIDFDNETVSITKQTVKRNFGMDIRKVYKEKHKKEDKSSWYFTEPKYGSSRTLRMLQKLIKLLREEKVRQMKNELEYGEYYTMLRTQTQWKSLR